MGGGGRTLICPLGKLLIALKTITRYIIFARPNKESCHIFVIKTLIERHKIKFVVTSLGFLGVRGNMGRGEGRMLNLGFGTTEHITFTDR